MISKAWTHGAIGVMAMAIFASAAAAQGAVRLPKLGTPPTPMQMIVPPSDSVPASLRGQAVRVVFTVDSIGRVSGIGTIPAITDSLFAKRLAATMKGYRFRPAKDSAGKAVGGEFRIDIAFKH